MILFENIELLILFLIMIIITAIACAVSIIAFGKYAQLEKKYELFMTGKDAESLEEFFLDIQEDLDKLVEDNKRNKEIIKILNRTIKRTFQKVGIYKYDAFEEKTGKRSFAMALLDYTNTGMVLTFQSTMDGTIVFVKDVEAGATGVKLGPEEEKAMKIAMGEMDKFSV